MSVAVLGAAGTIAPAIIRDLAESDEVGRMLLLDLDGDRAQAVAGTHGGRKATAQTADARATNELAALLSDADVLVNTASYRINLEAMQACLTAGCRYLDLGGLYWMTRRQRELHRDFEQAGLVAVLGIGSSPGKTNLMARHGTDWIGRDEEIESIDVAAAGRDPVGSADGRLRPPYALQTLLDELTLAPVVIRDGHAAEIEPLTDGGVIDYGDPIGEAQAIYTLHSELATFAESFGCRAASFRLSLAPALLSGLKGLVGSSPLEVAAAAAQAAPASNQTVSVHLVTIRTRIGRTVEVRARTGPHFGLVDRSSPRPRPSPPRSACWRADRSWPGGLCHPSGASNRPRCLPSSRRAAAASASAAERVERVERAHRASRSHATVSARPSRRSTFASQPSSWRAFSTDGQRRWTSTSKLGK